MNSTDIRDAFGRRIELHESAEVTSMGGLCACVEHLRRCGVLEALHNSLDPTLPERGQAGKVRYSAAQLLELRLLALIAGREDLNDFKKLPSDPGYMLACGLKELPSFSTLCRFERDITDETLKAGNKFLLDMYFRYSGNQKYIFIDIDNTPVELYGHQENVKFNGHYGCNCYLPLLAFIDGFPIAVHNGNEDGRKVMVKHLKTLVDFIRARRPNSVIILRADSGFNGTELIDLCEKTGCYYLIGLAPNKRLQKLLELWEPEFVDVVRRPPKVGGSLLRHYGELDEYTAATWSKPRRVIVRDYWDDERRQWDPRFIQTNIPSESDGRCGKLWRLGAHELYAHLYCERGTMEKFNQEFKAQAFGSRASSSRFKTNSYRMLLAALCQLFFRILRTCFYGRKSSWYSANLNTFRRAFVCVPALLVQMRTKVKIHLNTGSLSRGDFCRFWAVPAG